jgi:hypothetical protein
VILVERGWIPDQWGPHGGGRLIKRSQEEVGEGNDIWGPHVSARNKEKGKGRRWAAREGNRVGPARFGPVEFSSFSFFLFSPFSDLDFKFESIFLWEVQTQVNFLYLHDNIN